MYILRFVSNLANIIAIDVRRYDAGAVISKYFV